MSITFIFLTMIFAHIIDDWYLQGKLAEFKQQSFWEKNTPDPLYKNDYYMALWLHSFSWSFMIMLPVAFYQNFNINEYFLMFFSMNIVIHGITDNEKANEHSINLITDQIIHLVQIIITFIVLVYFNI